MTMNQTLGMMLFVITEIELTNSTSAHRGAKLTFRMSRKILSEMMTTYIPSLLLIFYFVAPSRGCKGMYLLGL